MKIFDAHNHLTDETSHLYEISSSGMCCCASTAKEWDALLRIPWKGYTRVALGIHPWYCDATPSEWQSQLEHQLQKRSELWIGECGLDLYRAKKGLCPSIELQIDIWIGHLELAKKNQRPLVIHCVHAFHLMAHSLKTLNIPFLMHRFSGSREEMRSIFAWGGMISIHPKSLERNSFCNILQELGPKGFLIESDALPQEEYWPQFNEMMEKLSLLWGISTPDLMNLLWLQSRNFFFPTLSATIANTDTP